MKIKAVYLYCQKLLAHVISKQIETVESKHEQADSLSPAFRDGVISAYANEDGVSNAIGSVIKQESGEKTKDRSVQVHGCSIDVLQIVDDNSEIREFIRDSFSDSFSVVEAADGYSGFQRAVDTLPQLIITDVCMPNMNGIELCRKLKQDVRTSHIPVILLTGKTSDSDILAGLKSGADDYITKPFNAEILKTKVINLLDFKRRLEKTFSGTPKMVSEIRRQDSVEDPFLRRAVSVVEKNLNDPLFCVDEFAREMSVSRAQLYRKIQAGSGETAKEFIRNMRLKRAAELLIASNYNISEVAFEVGFNSLAYFTKSFSEYFGLTPSKYILKMRQKGS